MSSAARIACAACMLGWFGAAHSAQVELSPPELLTRMRRGPGPPADLALRLPDGERLAARIERFERTPSGGHTAYGELPDGHGYLALAAHGDALVGVLWSDDRLFRIGPRDASGAPQLWRAASTGLPTCDLAGEHAAGDPPSTVAPEPDGTSAQRATLQGPTQGTFTYSPRTDGSAEVQVDVLVAWTPEAETAAGGESVIRALIDLAVLETNTAFQKSQVDLRLRLVFASEVSYVESGSMATDLDRLRDTADGHMDIVHTWRDTYGADAVSLFVADDTKCGRSYNMGSPPSASFASSAFNLVSQGCATGYYAFGHEFGHNFGLDHDRPNTANTPSRPYAYGYWQTNNLYRTIMALERSETFGVRLIFFSNPGLSLVGRVLGLPESVPQPSDCARALNENAAILSAWRPTLVP